MSVICLVKLRIITKNRAKNDINSVRGLNDKQIKQRLISCGPRRLLFIGVVDFRCCLLLALFANYFLGKLNNWSDVYSPR